MLKQPLFYGTSIRAAAMNYRQQRNFVIQSKAIAHLGILLGRIWYNPFYKMS
jgi:hypothetical protein